jgi:membrane-anchored protein YejM (alkaline phosphatase superfamily)
LTLSNFVFFKIFFVGFFYDVVAFLHLSLPVVLYFTLIPSTAFSTLANRVLIYLLLFFTTAVLIFTFIYELTFWQIYADRLNFIALEQLRQYLYGSLLPHNSEYYLYIAIATVISAIFVKIVLSSTAFIKHFDDKTTLFTRLKIASISFFIPFLVIHDISEQLTHISSNDASNSVSKNSFYHLYRAWTTNNYTYDRFYPTTDINNVNQTIQNNLHINNSTFITPTTRHILHTGQQKNHNVVLITMDHTQASNFKHTPSFLAFAQHAITFSNLYRTGVTQEHTFKSLFYAMPLLPSSSLHYHEHLINMIKPFQEHHYQLHYFDTSLNLFNSLHNFIASHGFDVHDFITNQTSTSIVDNALQTANNAYLDQEPFFILMNLSEDHTIEPLSTFLVSAREQAWYDQTIFIIISTQSKPLTLKQKSVINNFKSSFYLMSPTLIQEPKNIPTIASQIDIFPTLFALLNWSYTTNFYGKNIFSTNPKDGRAFLGDNLNLGYLTPKLFSIVEPKKSIRSFDPLTFQNYTNNQTEANNLLSYYQHAWLTLTTQ